MSAVSILGWLWVAFFLAWLVLALFNKKASRSAPGRGRAWGFRLAVIAAAVMLAQLRRHEGPGWGAALGRVLSAHAGLGGQWLGVGLSFLGFAFAFWARVHLGRNWGIPMSLRQDHELITSGPYAYVRHPIYTGILLAMLGSALAMGSFWLVLFALAFLYFLISARTEETMMLGQFPQAYPAYRRRTRMLIPFVF
jgi:protein-S-isoprenylcysteine O-methyltransferase Ste14